MNEHTLVRKMIAKRRATPKPSLAQIVQDESAELVRMQRRLHDAGLVVTAAAINKAANELGWEAVRLMEKEATK